MRLKSVAILSASLLTLAPAANAATFVFDLSSGSSIGTSYGNVNQYITTVGGNTVKMQASAWRLNGNTIRNAYLGTYSAGLGATNRAEDGNNSTHTVDNQLGTDFIVFQFDKPVEFISAKFTTYTISGVQSGDSDASIDFGTTANGWNSTLGLTGQSKSTLDALMNGAGFESLGASAANGVVRNLQPGSPGTKVGNLWVVASSFINQDGKVDSFKLDDLTVSYIDPLPEPGSWALMLAGFGMVGFSLRRRKALAAA